MGAKMKKEVKDAAEEIMRTKWEMIECLSPVPLFLA